MRIGAVNYLNSKPLVSGLDALAPKVQLLNDLPSRLADSLASGRLDVALIPSVEFFRTPGYTIVSDACVACEGPVLSVKLYFRVPPAEVRRVALDEGSRSSVALAKILLREMVGAAPQWESLPIGCGMSSTDADAVLLIGDRAIRSTVQGAGSTAITDSFLETWDLGERWCQWTRLPFVFAMWVARPETDVAEASAVLSAARDRGVGRLEEIAVEAAPTLGVTPELASRYLRDNLHFTLASREREGLMQFYRLCVEHDLAPPGRAGALESCYADGCTPH
jgi:chorismate dehydratase